jgi:uncharacterized membrane protein YkvA (DUF1232 family)
MKNPMQVFYTWFTETLRNPKYRWWIVIGSLVYLFSPLDIAPDFIPVIGQLDDITILGLLVAELTQMLSEYMKSRKGNVAPAEGEAVSTANAATTIEIDAVPVSENSQL